MAAPSYQIIFGGTHHDTQVKTPLTVCCIYRTKATTEEYRIEAETQRTICRNFIREHGWFLLREFWQGEAPNDDVALETDDALLELRAGAEQKAFDIVLVSDLKRLGRTPYESPFAAAFFEKTGVEVWTANNKCRWDVAEFDAILETWTNEATYS